jgi:hypothetical protein
VTKKTENAHPRDHFHTGTGGGGVDIAPGETLPLSEYRLALLTPSAFGPPTLFGRPLPRCEDEDGATLLPKAVLEGGAAVEGASDFRRLPPSDEGGRMAP